MKIKRQKAKKVITSRERKFQDYKICLNAAKIYRKLFREERI